MLYIGTMGWHFITLPSRPVGVPWAAARQDMFYRPFFFDAAANWPRQCKGGLPVHKSSMPLSASKKPRPIKTLVGPALPPGNQLLGSRAPKGPIKLQCHLSNFPTGFEVTGKKEKNWKKAKRKKVF